MTNNFWDYKMKNFKSNISLLSFLLIFLTHCIKIKSILNNDINKEDGEIEAYLLPQDAKVTLKPITLEDSPIVKNLKLPKVTLHFNHSNFVQVIRCQKDTKLHTLTGDKPSSDLPRSILESVWIDAKKRCVIVATNFASTVFYDLTVQQGSYYYVINPCLSDELSIYGKYGNNCSYNLQFTQAISVPQEGTIKQQEIQIAQKLSEKESILNAHLNNAKQLARKIELHLRACETLLNQDINLLNYKNGLLRLSTLALGFMVGAFIGPNAAVMLGMFTQEIGTRLIQWKLKIPNTIENECINPAVVAKNEEQRKLANLDDPTSMSGNAGKYEEEFRVQYLIQKLEKLIDPNDGEVKKATDELELALSNLEHNTNYFTNMSYTIHKYLNSGTVTDDIMIEILKTNSLKYQN